jgi:uncharacterized damage-inducible protein DinB
MITPDYCRTMAAYNAWQNENLLAAAHTLDDAARTEERGAFFGSIAGTLSHLLWADLVWMARFTGVEAPQVGIPDSPGLWPDWMPYCTARREQDAVIAVWARAQTPESLTGTVSWFSGVLGREVTKPRALLVAHMFNHQTHHRGQVHAMLTAAGARPGDTDLPFMPA